MIQRGSRINVRNTKDFDIKMLSRNISLGEVEEISWAPIKDAPEEGGLIQVGLSVKVKEFNPRSKATPKDTFVITINGRPSNPRFARVAESVQQVTMVPVTIKTDGVEKEQPLPEEFEEKVLYSFKGLMLAPEQK